jgi:carboxypeptidase Taq
MQLGSHPGFIALLAPLIEAFGEQPAFAPDNLARLLTRVKPRLIRVDADEVTYPAHVMLRYEIERPLIEGEIEPEDIPALWDAKMQELLGLDTAATSRTAACRTCTGPRRCSATSPATRWARCTPRSGSPPCAALMPDLDARIAAGELSPVFDWLRDHIWTQGQPLDHRRTGVARQRRGAEPGALRRVLQKHHAM